MKSKFELQKELDRRSSFYGNRVTKDESQISKFYLALDQNGTMEMLYFTFTSANHKTFQYLVGADQNYAIPRIRSTIISRCHNQESCFC